MKEEIKDYCRQDLFDYYHKRSNPFVFVTTKIDITNICKTISILLSIIAKKSRSFEDVIESGSQRATHLRYQSRR